jgi:CRISP-associated protein Cas1
MTRRDLHELPRFRDGLSYIYVEHCKVDQEAKAIEVWDKDGRVMIPVAALAVLMLGPGTSITHAAIRVLADNGCLAIWCGEEGVRFYAQGLGETRKGYHLLRQAEMASDPAKRIEVVIRMYRYRFGESLATDLSLAQIRGYEGVRVRDAYYEASKLTGVPWKGRNYDRSDWGAGDPVNRSLSAANACLNGICHSAIVTGGYSPGIGFVHTGRLLSFVYDIADLYKVELTVPLAFQAAANGEQGLETRVRRACRDMFRKQRLLERILPDIDYVLGVTREEAEEDSPGEFWSPEGRIIPGGRNYAGDGLGEGTGVGTG